MFGLSMVKPLVSHALEWAEQGQSSSSVLATAQRLLALQEAIAKQLPLAMRDKFAVSQVKGNELTLIVEHAALASKLRQLQPTLLKHIQLAGFNVETLKFKVASRPNRPPVIQSQKLAQPLNETDLGHFEALGSQLDAGPLADAVRRLLAHHRSGSQANKG